MSQTDSDFIKDVEKLKALRIIKKDTEIVEKTGYSKGVVSNYLSGNIPASENFKKKFYEVYGTFLEQNKVSDNETMYQKGNIIHVPLYAYGGFLRGYSSKVYVDSLQHYSLPGITGTHYSFEISGMSMYAKDDSRAAGPGDWVIGREEESINSMAKNKGYILQTIDGIIYKIFDKFDDSKAYFSSLNPEYGKEIIFLKSIKKIYFVIKILKNPYT